METNLKKWRKLRKISAKRLATAANMTPGNYYKHERGEQAADMKTLGIWARELNVEPGQLMEKGPPAGLKSEGAMFEPPQGHYLAVEPASGLDLWRVDNSRLEMAGLRNGDVALVDSRAGFLKDLKTEDIVLVQQYYSDPAAPSGQAAVTIFRQFVSPALLITNSRDRNEPSLVMNHDNVTVMGVVRSIHRV